MFTLGVFQNTFLKFFCGSSSPEFSSSPVLPKFLRETCSGSKSKKNEYIYHKKNDGEVKKYFFNFIPS